MRPGGRGAALVLVLALAACASADHAPPRPVAEPGDRGSGPPDALRAELEGGRAPGCGLRGVAVSLGDGLFLTAAHLVDDLVPRLRQCAGAPVDPVIRYAGRRLTARLLRAGEGHVEPGIGPLYRRGEDLALLRTAAVPGPAARPCEDGPAPGQAVLVLTAGQRRAGLAGGLVPEHLDRDGAYADLAIPLLEGDSGAGVFDPERGCLLGVVSHRPDAEPDRTRIVPAGTIRAFLHG